MGWEDLAMKGPSGRHKAGEEAASTCHIPITAAHRHGHTPSGVTSQSMCTGTFWKLLCYLSSTHSGKGSHMHTHTQSRILSCIHIVLYLAGSP